MTFVKGFDTLQKYALGKRMFLSFRTVYGGMNKLPKNPYYGKELGLMQNLSSGPLVSDRDKTPDGPLLYQPFKKIPDIRKFEILLSNYDVVYAAFGIRKRGNPQLSFTPYKNRSMNRYLLNQKLRLVKLANNGSYDAYFRISRFLMIHSKVFYISQLSHSYTNGHRKFSFKGVKQLYQNYLGLVKNEAYELDYKRVFIPKSETKHRPLGVPTPAGIMYLGLGNRFLMLFVMTRNLINENQHAYLPGKGTKTAGEVIFREVIHARYIYSFDLASFFPSVDHNFIYKTMENKGFPDGVCKGIGNLNSSLPKDLYFTHSEGEEIEQVSEPYKEEDLARESLGKKLPYETKVEETEDDPYGELGTRGLKTGAAMAARGVPQGGPISPLVSLLCLDSLFNQKEFKTLMYADDGLFYSDSKLSYKAIEKFVNKGSQSYMESGVRFEPKKSFGVKRSGGFSKLKFLGLSYDGGIDQLQADTRRGSKLVFDKEELLDMLRFREEVSSNSGPKTNKPSFENMIKLKVGGLIQSRLYSGKGNQDFEQDFDYTFIKGSGAHIRRKGVNTKSLTVFNSTSFASKTLAYVLKHCVEKKPKIEGEVLQEAQITGNLMREILSNSSETIGATREKEEIPLTEEAQKVKLDTKIHKGDGTVGGQGIEDDMPIEMITSEGRGDGEKTGFTGEQILHSMHARKIMEAEGNKTKPEGWEPRIGKIKVPIEQTEQYKEIIGKAKEARDNPYDPKRPYITGYGPLKHKEQQKDKK